MPTHVKSTIRPSKAAMMIDRALVLARTGLICVAIVLATLILVEVEIASWQAGPPGPGVTSDLQDAYTAP
jgi:hypothetical protein